MDVRAVDGMSPRDRDHYRGGKSSLIIENFGTGNQAIKPKLASFRKNAISQSGLFPDWLRFATMVPDPDSGPNRLRFVEKVISQSGLVPGLASFRYIVPDRNSGQNWLRFVEKVIRQSAALSRIGFASLHSA